MKSKIFAKHPEKGQILAFLDHKMPISETLNSVFLISVLCG
jgi:hypothetical protein